MKILRSSRSRDEFPLGSLCLLVFSLTALCLWTLIVLDHRGPMAMDIWVQSMVATLDVPWAATASELLARVGDTRGVIALILPWAIWLLWARHLAAFLHVGAGLGGIAIANTLMKSLTGRERPDAPDYLSDSLAYPSAHTSAAVVLYGLAAVFIARELPPRRRAWAYWIAILLTVPMALSRLTLGVHWASDLIGGALLGLVVCALVQISYHRFVHRPLAPAPWLPLAGASLLLLMVRVVWLPLA